MYPYIKEHNMIKELIRDPILLERKSDIATKEDFQASNINFGIQKVNHCNGVLI